MESRFLLDGMLGKLARWLRILGYDTAYTPELNDTELLRISQDETRILITRDRDLHRRAIMNNLKTHFLENTSLSEWLLSLENKYNLKFDLEAVEPRCSICNQPLDKAIEKTMLKGVPIGVRKTMTEFWHCQTCGKIYWEGTHWLNIRSFLRSLKREV